LAKTGLVESCGRGTFRISAKGRADLPSLPAQLDRKFFESRGYATWKSTAPAEPPGHDAGGSSDSTLTPEEQIDETLAELKEDLEQEVLAQLRTMNPASFE
jgi:restriction system protein